MSDKQELIKEMLELQKKFVNYEHQQGVNPDEYWGDTDAKHPLHQYRERYAEIASKVIDLAHAEKHSKR